MQLNLNKITKYKKPIICINMLFCIYILTLWHVKIKLIGYNCFDKDLKFQYTLKKGYKNKSNNVNHLNS